MAKLALDAKVKRKLTAYQEQATNFQQLAQTKKTSYISSLASLTPLMAMSVLPTSLDAQCEQGGIVVRQSAGGCVQDVEVDIDGDGIYDVRFEANAIRARMRVNNNATMSFAGAGYLFGMQLPFLSNINTGGTIPGAYNFVNTNSSYILSTNGGQGDFYPTGGTSPVTGYIGFRKGNEYGFIELTVSKMNGIQGASSCITVGRIGLSYDMGNSVQAGICTTLPVELIHFEASEQKESIKLLWETANEINNLGFEVERRTSEEDFQKIAWIGGENTTQNPRVYEYIDTDIKTKQTYFYRLKQFNLDGLSEYSEVVSIDYDPDNLETKVELFPNPAEQYIQFRVNSPIGTFASIEIFTQTAQRVHEVEGIPITQGTNHLGMSVAELSAGTYFAKIRIGNKLLYKRVVIL